MERLEEEPVRGTEQPYLLVGRLLKEQRKTCALILSSSYPKLLESEHRLSCSHVGIGHLHCSCVPAALGARTGSEETVGTASLFGKSLYVC